MPIKRVVGFDGGITMPTAVHNGALRTWNAAFDTYMGDVTRFGDTLRSHKLGIMNITGSATGVPIFDTGSAEPGVGDKVAAGSALTLTSATACTFAMTAMVFPVINVSSDYGADAGLEFQFASGVSNALTETWDET